VKETTHRLLNKAEHSIRAAEVLLRENEIDFAVARAYYALFYIASALLFEKGLESRKHSGVHAMFGEHFAKPGLLDAKYHRSMLVAFERRLEGDYGFEVVITEDDVIETITTAREFLDVARQYLQADAHG
jgi:uncharacterized protein (UPF0332 family)